MLVEWSPPVDPFYEPWMAAEDSFAKDQKPPESKGATECEGSKKCQNNVEEELGSAAVSYGVADPRS